MSKRSIPTWGLAVDVQGERIGPGYLSWTLAVLSLERGCHYGSSFWSTRDDLSAGLMASGFPKGTMRQEYAHDETLRIYAPGSRVPVAEMRNFVWRFVKYPLDKGSEQQ